EQRVDVDLDGRVQEAVDEDGGLGAPSPGEVAADVVDQAGLVVDDLHAAPAEHVARAHEHGVADLRGDVAGVLPPPRGGVGRAGQIRVGEDGPEVAAVLGEVDRRRAGADDRQDRKSVV